MVSLFAFANECFGKGRKYTDTPGGEFDHIVIQNANVSCSKVFIADHKQAAPDQSEDSQKITLTNQKTGSSWASKQLINKSVKILLGSLNTHSLSEWKHLD